MTIEYSKDYKAVVDRSYKWRKIDADTPERMKIQLINKEGSGVAYYGTYAKGEDWATHWCPLPTFDKE